MRHLPCASASLLLHSSKVKKVEKLWLHTDEGVCCGLDEPLAYDAITQVYSTLVLLK